MELELRLSCSMGALEEAFAPSDGKGGRVCSTSRQEVWRLLLLLMICAVDRVGIGRLDKEKRTSWSCRAS